MADTIKQYVSDKTQCSTEYRALVDSSIWNVVRIDRDKLLAESDWTVMPDSPLSTSKQNEWKTYRQSLRDIPQTYRVDGYSAVVWPTVPSTKGPHTD